MDDISTRLVSIRTLAPDEHQLALSELLDSAPHAFEVWMEYIYFLQHVARQPKLPLELCELALRCCGAHPASLGLWTKVIERCVVVGTRLDEEEMGAAEDEREGSEAALHFFQRAFSMPLTGNRTPLLSLYDSWIMRQAPKTLPHQRAALLQEAQLLVQKSNAHFTGQPTWPPHLTRITADDENGGAAEAKRQWQTLLRFLFMQLSKALAKGGADPVISTELICLRIDLAFRQMCYQLPRDDSTWAHYAMFLVIQMRNPEDAVSVCRDGLGHCPSSVALVSLLEKLTCSVRAASTTRAPEQDEARVADPLLQALIEQRRLGYSLPQSRKSFRSIGKGAEGSKVGDWRVYNQWLKFEATALNDPMICGQVLQRGLNVCASSLDDYALLANTAVQYHLSRHSESEVLSTLEKLALEARQRRRYGCQVEAWNIALSTERRLGLPYDGRTEAKQSTATQQRHACLTREVYRRRVGALLPVSLAELEWIQFYERICRHYEEHHPSDEGSHDDELQVSQGTVSCKYRRLDNSSGDVTQCRSQSRLSTHVVDTNAWVPLRMGAAAGAAQTSAEQRESLFGFSSRHVSDPFVEARIALAEALKSNSAVARSQHEDSIALNHTHSATAQNTEHHQAFEPEAASRYKIPAELASLTAVVRETVESLPEHVVAQHKLQLCKLNSAWLLHVLTNTELNLLQTMAKHSQPQSIFQ